MAKRDNGTPRAKGGRTTSTRGAMTADSLEQRVLAFAEQLGRMAGTIQGKAEGLLDSEALNEHIATVRDGAAHLLNQLAGSAPKGPSKKAAAATARGRNTGRSGGVVDAPGKKHRRPAPAGPSAKLADSQASKMRTAKTMVKTNRHRGRG